MTPALPAALGHATEDLSAPEAVTTIALLVWLGVLSIAVARMLRPGLTPPQRWSYVAVTWTVALVPPVLLTARGGW